jgi:hypothetical protein
MTHPQKASAVLVDVANRLVKRGVEDIVNVRLWRATALDPDMTVRLEVKTQADADKVAAEFGLPAEKAECHHCGSTTAAHGRTYSRSITDYDQGQFVLAADDTTVYVVIEVNAPRDAALVGAHS